MLTSSPWVTANNPLAYAREGAQLGLQARGQDLTKHDAVANRLRFAYDALAQRQWQARQNSADRAVALAATLANKGYNEDALENYRQQQIQARQDQLAEAKEKTSSAADALKSAHEDTAKFVADADTMGAAKALSLHPNADKTVVNHVMALEQSASKTPPEKVTTEEIVPGTKASGGRSLLDPRTWFGAPPPIVPATPDQKLITTRSIPAGERLSSPAAETQPASMPAASELVSVINPGGKRVRIKKSDFINGHPPEGYSLAQ